MNYASSARAAAIQAAQRVIETGPVYLDTETTGITTNDEIIELAIIDRDGSPLFNQLVRPTRKIPPEATAINNITDAQVAGASPLPFVWQSIRAILDKRVIATYNAEFDLRMIRQSLALYNISWQTPVNQFCIMKCYAQFIGDWDIRRRSYRNFSLEMAGRNCGIAIPNSHRACDDALLAREVLHFIAMQT